MSNSSSRSVGFGVLLSTILTMSSRFLAVVVNFAIVALLSPEQYGVFVGVQAIIFIGLGFCDLGLSHAYRQQVSRDNSLAVRLMGSSILIQTAAVLLYFVGAIIYLQDQEMLSTSAILIAIGALISQLPTVAIIDLSINRRFTQLGVVGFLPIFGLVLGLTLAFLFPDRLLGLAVGYMLGSIVTIAVAMKMVGLSRFRLKFGLENITQMRVGVPFMASILISKIGQFFGVAYILSLEGAYMAGILGLALKIYQVMLMTATTSTTVILPYLHKLSAEDNISHLGVVTWKLIGPIWVISACLAGVIILAPAEVVALIGRNQYGDAAGLLRIFGFAFLFKAISIPAGNILEGRGLQWLRVCVQTVSTMIIVISILFLYSDFGVEIVAYSVLVADVTSFILLWGISAYGIGHVLPWPIHLKSIVIIAAGLAILPLLPMQGLVTASVFVLYVVVATTLLRVWQPEQIVRYLRA